MGSETVRKHQDNNHLSLRSSHLFDFGHIPNEGVIVHKVQELLQLVQVSDVVLTNSLNNMIIT